jgi:hypothetical protein
MISIAWPNGNWEFKYLIHKNMSFETTKSVAKFPVHDGTEVFSLTETASGEPMRQLMRLVENNLNVAAIVKKFFSDEVDSEIKMNDARYADLILEVTKIVTRCLDNDSKVGILADQLSVSLLKLKNRLN